MSWLSALGLFGGGDAASDSERRFVPEPKPEPYSYVDLPYMTYWTAGMFVSWYMLLFVFQRWTSFFPASYRWSALMVMKKPGLMAYMVMIMVPVLALSYYGVMTMWIHFADQEQFSFHDRIHSVPFGAERICMLQITMNGVAIVLGIIIGEPLYNKEYIIHHFMTALSSWTNMAPFPYSLHYGTYYGGVIELTNVPLTFMDVFRNFKELRLWYPKMYAWTRAAFALSFMLVRFLPAQLITFRLVKDWVRYFYLASYYPSASSPIVDAWGREVAVGGKLQWILSSTLGDIEVIDVRHHPLQILYTLAVFIIVYSLNLFWAYKITTMSLEVLLNRPVRDKGVFKHTDSPRDKAIKETGAASASSGAKAKRTNLNDEFDGAEAKKAR